MGFSAIFFFGTLLSRLILVRSVYFATWVLSSKFRELSLMIGEVLHVRLRESIGSMRMRAPSLVGLRTVSLPDVTIAKFRLIIPNPLLLSTLILHNNSSSLW